MTENKRFISNGVFLKDNDTQIVMECAWGEDAINMAEQLNNLYEENRAKHHLLQVYTDFLQKEGYKITDIINHSKKLVE